LKKHTSEAQQQRLVAEVLQEAHAFLQLEFKEEELIEVGVEWRLGERHDGRPSERWGWFRWTVQVGNDHGRGESLEEALCELRKSRGVKAQIPDRAARIVALLREIPDEGFARHDVLRAAQLLLEKERRGG
jgi:hypothetical protein